MEDDEFVPNNMTRSDSGFNESDKQEILIAFFVEEKLSEQLPNVPICFGKRILFKQDGMSAHSSTVVSNY